MTSDIYVHISDVFLWTLQKIPEPYPITRSGSPPQTDSFCRFSDDSPEILWKLSADGRSPHQQIKRNSGTLRSENYVCNYLLISFIQRRLTLKWLSFKILLSSRIVKNCIITEICTTTCPYMTLEIYLL